MKSVLLIPLIGLAAILALPALAQLGGTATSDFPMAVQTSSTACKMAGGVTCKGNECPQCSVATSPATGYVRAGLLFPDNKLSCIYVHGTVPDAFDDLFANRSLDLRIEWEQLSGGSGASFGEQCTPASGCFKLQVSTAYATEGIKLDAMPFSAITETDWMANQNAGFGRKNTGTARNVDRTLAAKRRPVVYKVCRDSRTANASDKLAGNIRVLWMYAAYPTSLIGSTATEADN